MASKFFTELWTVKMGDWERGLVVAVIMAPFTTIIEYLEKSNWDINWKKIAALAVAGGLAYIVKNLVTGSQGRYLTNK